MKNHLLCLAAQEKVKPKTTAELFGSDEDDDEDGDIFSVGSRSAISQQSKKVAEEEEVVQPPEKKVVLGRMRLLHCVRFPCW